MHLERGGIYLAALNPSKGHEPGKVRPVLVFQHNELNRVGHTTVIVLPLTTQVIPDAFPLRYPLAPREKLEEHSDILCDQIRAVDVRRITSEKLALLDIQEIQSIEMQVQIVLGIDV